MNWKQYQPLAILTVITLAAALWSFNFIPNWNKGDQKKYYNQARVIQQKGIFGGFDYLVEEYIEKKNAHKAKDSSGKAHHPLRVSRILLHRFAMIFIPNIRSGAWISIFAFIIIIYLTFFFVKRYWDTRHALLTAILLACAPLLLAYAGKAMSELPYCLTVLLAFFSFFLLVNEPENRKHLIFFILSLTFSITNKEQSVFLIPFFGGGMLLAKWFYGRKITYQQILLAFAIPGILLVGIYLLFFGFSNLQEIVTAQTQRHLVSERYYGHIALKEGPWYRYIVDFFVLSPITSILFFIGLAYYLFKYKAKQPFNELMLLAFFVYTLLVFNLIIKNVRYVIFLDLIYRFFATVAIIVLIDMFINEKWKQYATMLVLALVMVANFGQANNLFIKNKTGNVLSFKLFAAEGFYNIAALDQYNVERYQNIRQETLDRYTRQIEKTINKKTVQFKEFGTKVGLAELHNMKAMDYLVRGDVESGVEEAEKALTYRSKSVVTFGCLCEGYFRLKQYDKAIEYCEETLGILPNYPGARRYLNRAHELNY